MTKRQDGKLADLVPITQLAQRSDPPMDRQKLYRRLRALHRTYGGDWLVRTGRNIYVNPVSLRAAHPGVFDPPELVARVSDLEEEVSVLKRESLLLAQKTGEVSRRVRALEGRA